MSRQQPEARSAGTRPDNPGSGRTAWWWMFGAAFAVLAAIAITTPWLLHEAGMAATPTDRVQARIDAVRTGLAAGAGVGAAAGLLLAFRRQQHHELVSALSELDATEKRITDLYTKAADQIGSSQAAVRLAGLYAMERVAQDNPRMRQTVVDVICAYLRMPFTLPADTSSESQSPAAVIRDHRRRYEAVKSRRPARAATAAETGQVTDPHSEKQVRLTAQRILAKHLHISHMTFWSDIEVDLTGAQLIDFNFEGCVVGDANFKGATFSGGANFKKATFSGVADFDRAMFTGCINFNSASFSKDAIFTRTKWYDDVYFQDTTFFDDADFQLALFTCDAWFGGATMLDKAWFSYASFSANATFSYVTFSDDTRFQQCVFSSHAVFLKAKFSGDTMFEKAEFYGDAWFKGATFTGRTAFEEAKFSSNTSFEDTKFGRRSGFQRTVFSGQAGFEGTSFSGHAMFWDATFTGNARFSRSVFSRDATFGQAEFRSGAWFDRATFSGAAIFEQATFCGDVRFEAAELHGTTRLEGAKHDTAPPMGHGQVLPSWPAGWSPDKDGVLRHTATTQG